MNSLTTDVCVVGAGVAGSLLATKLAEAGRQVVLIEQGVRPSANARFEVLEKSRHGDFGASLDSQTPEAFRSISPESATEGGHKYSLFTVSGVGGSGLHWLGVSPRPLAADLRVRSLFGYGRDWPIPYDELEPWLLEAENELGVAGGDDSYASPRSGPFPMPAHTPTEFDRTHFGPAVAKLGMKAHPLPIAVASRPYQGRSACARCRYCFACPTGARYAPDLVHIPRFEATGKGKLVTGTHLRRLETKGGSIVAAHCVTIDGSEFIARATTFVLCLGGVETPRMPLLSADQGSRHGLGNAGGQLGVGFSDHLFRGYPFTVKGRLGGGYGYPTAVTDYHRVHVDRKKTGTFVLQGSPYAHPIESVAKLIEKATDKDVVNVSMIREGLAGLGALITYHEMDSTGRLELGTTKDKHGDPIARVTLRASAREEGSLAIADRAAERICEAMGAESLGKIPDERESKYPLHPAGGAAMGKTPDQGACDTNLKVFGLNNLYIASGAALPHQGPNNVTLTIAALTLRLARQLTGKDLER